MVNSMEEGLYIYNAPLVDDGPLARPALKCVSSVDVLIVELIAIVITVTPVAMFAGQMVEAQDTVTVKDKVLVNLTGTGSNLSPRLPINIFPTAASPSCPPQEEVRVFFPQLSRASSSLFFS